MRSGSSLVRITRNTVTLLAVCGAFLLQTGQAFAGDDYTYVGSAKCKICHNKEAVGAQYTKWQESAHAKAFEVLGTPEAAKIAKEKGVEGSPQEAAACMQCHATAWGVAEEALGKLAMEEGVSCESCHGPGSAYWKKSTMEKLAAGEVEPASVGLTMPTEATCKGCHNEKSPTFKGFDFKVMAAKIAHPHPDNAGE